MPDERLAVIILAAGRGTRMKSAIPKLLHPLGGVPMISHVLASARELDAARVLVVVRYERDQIARVVASELPDAVIVDQDEIPGTGRAVEQAVAALPAGFDGDVLVVNGDVPLLNAATLRGVVETHRASGAPMTILTTNLDEPDGYGRVLRAGDGGVERVVEHADAGVEELVVTEINAGVYLFQAQALREGLPAIGVENAQGEKYLTDLVGVLHAAGARVEAKRVTPSWLVAGINNRAQLGEVARRLNAMIVRGWQLAGVTVQDPATTWIDLRVTLAPDVTILPGTQLHGTTSIATGATIGPDTTLVDCRVGQGASVRRTDATEAVIEAEAKVGPFAYLRPGTRLAAGGKIGTFVETKNAVIGRGSKVPHLSYVGDATVGEGANIGAATIFANYDGVNKHASKVGSHVRTGSHNVFVAPVEIGDGAYTGAGTVVRRDVPAGALAINEAPQRNIEGWVARKRPGTEAAKAAGEGDD
ncbi:MAG TPA: bifunctional UDP-N-acetylglucosamine diphosphorylase/glucosamine-1-phosphate N-acetyltransferase GlmU [Microbacteriaceae bacterium]|nr:bifunctional UDP-N-acetylglucosamine diphosphorylase/glucosamine-1-phosphate N-acetyltransferase GlmU [Microbacteriaceae bacterium]